MMTVKELREKLAAVPDDLPVAMYDPENADYWLPETVEVVIVQAQRTVPPYNYVDSCVSIRG